MLVRLAAILCITGCAAGEEFPPPAISGIAPGHAMPGVTVTIFGDYFCQQPEDDTDPLACVNVGSVEFGQVPGTVSMYTEHQITAEVPNVASGKLRVAVSVKGRRSSSVEFEVDAL